VPGALKAYFSRYGNAAFRATTKQVRRRRRIPSGAAQHRFDDGSFEIVENDAFGKIDLRTEPLSLDAA
jgi:hypothetical protein